MLEMRRDRIMPDEEDSGIKGKAPRSRGACDLVLYQIEGRL